MAPEADAIAAADRPATVATITRDLRALGLEAGDVVIVHSSLSALGWSPAALRPSWRRC